MSSLQEFSCPLDVKFLRGVDAEKHRLYYKARRYLVHQRDTTPTNIYGEPGEITSSVDGDDGVTSVAATRQFTSAGSDFVTAGVKANDILEILNAPCDDSESTDEDNGRYQILTVDSTTQLTITQDWPKGELNELDFKVHILFERYTELAQPVPLLVKLNPTQKELDKWGIDEKRDAVLVFSIGLLEEIGLTPKIGDRFIYDYGQPDGGAASPRVIHYEIKNLFEADDHADSGWPLHYIGFATRTTNRLP